jgi:hypothetical protein
MRIVGSDDQDVVVPRAPPMTFTHCANPAEDLGTFQVRSGRPHVSGSLTMYRAPFYTYWWGREPEPDEPHDRPDLGSLNSAIGAQ